MSVLHLVLESQLQRQPDLITPSTGHDMDVVQMRDMEERSERNNTPGVILVITKVDVSR